MQEKIIDKSNLGGLNLLITVSEATFTVQLVCVNMITELQQTWPSLQDHYFYCYMYNQLSLML